MNQGDHLTHFDDHGQSRMVDVSQKEITLRRARASGLVRMQAATLETIQGNRLRKGNVWEVARLAGIQAAKQTGQLIPLCHPLGLDAVCIEFTAVDSQRVKIEAEVQVTARTGVEMEAMAAVSVAALTLYDMCKSIDRSMVIEKIQLEEKSGGRSGHYVRDPKTS